ncbi:MAG: DUF6517 family protein, partial [Halobacteria archaeon]|nr:DUF6517 family protein [Halobacteria archaeon]
ENRDDRSHGFSLTRRSLIKSGASIAFLTGVSGCTGLEDINLSQVQSYSFTALPVELEESPPEMSYSETNTGQDTVERNPDIAGVGAKVTITNQFAVYESDNDTLGMLSSPLAEVPAVDRSLNPLATKSMREVLTGQEGESFLRTAGVVENPDVTWARGPKLVNE